MKIYLSGPWVERADMEEYAARLVGEGHLITHPWWDVEAGLNEAELDAPFLRGCAEADVRGVLNANVVLVINSQKSEGKAVEQGIAIANKKPILVVGKDNTHIFQHLPFYRMVNTFDDAIETLRTISWLITFKDGK